MNKITINKVSFTPEEFIRHTKKKYLDVSAIRLIKVVFDSDQERDAFIKYFPKALNIKSSPGVAYINNRRQSTVKGKENAHGQLRIFRFCSILITYLLSGKNNFKIN